MNKMLLLMAGGYDLNLILTGDKSTYYVHLSHPKFGNDFGYGYGKTLDEAIDMEFGLVVFTETHQD